MTFATWVSPQRTSIPPTEKFVTVTADRYLWSKTSETSCGYGGCQGAAPVAPLAFAPVEILSPSTVTRSGFPARSSAAVLGRRLSLESGTTP